MNTLVLDPTENPSEDSLLPFAPRSHGPRRAPACFRRETDGDGICWLTFDTPGSSANVWNFDTLDELDRHVEDLHRDGSVRALVIRSAKERIYIAGADLKGMRSLTPDRMRELLALGQDVFQHLAALPFPKIAAIRGACVGGGFEMALACDHRIAGDSEFTRIGLPETQLGLVPGWGGSTRLPRLIGLPQSLELIVRGKVLPVRAAWRAGLIDQITAPENLDELARRIALGKTPARRRRPFRFTRLWPIPWFLRLRAKAALFAKFPWMRTEMAAPVVAVDVVTRGAMRSVPASLALEQDAVAVLAESPVTRSWMATFLRKEAASHKMPAGLSGVPARPVHNAAVIGAGVMGAGIAYALASKGVRVLLTETTPDLMARGLGRIENLLADGIKRHAISRKAAREIRDRISPACGAPPLRRMDLVIEAIVEDLDAKKKLFAELAGRVGEQTLLATNTSALSVSAIAAAVPHPERVVGLHFFNPAHVLPLVEIVTHEGISPETTAGALRFVQAVGKTPVLVQDSPGFVVNRILLPYLMEAVRFARNLRDPWKLDEAMMAFGMPMGPLRLLDEIGFDVALHVATEVVETAPRPEPGASLLDTLSSAGMLGRKNGRGFYRHQGAKARPNPEVLKFLNPRAASDDPAVLAARLVDRMRREAGRCRDEGVATAADIALAMTLGSGFPPFRPLFDDLPTPVPA